MYESTWKSTIRHFYPRWKYLCGTYFSKKRLFQVDSCIQFYRLTQLIFFQHYLRALSAKNANHLQTTDTLKRHQRYSIRYHCGWPSLGIWGSATHYGLPALPEPFLRACGLHNPDVQGDSMYESTWKSTIRHFLPPLEVPVWHIFFKKRLFQVDSCIQFYRLTQLIFSTSFKGIIRKECQSFTNHGHDKTPPTVFNPLSLWLTLPRDMGVSHTLWSPGITRAILACLWFAQYDVQDDSMY